MKKIILVVEDNQTHNDAYKTILEAEGFATIFTDNGDKAIQLALTQNPDLILLDVMLLGQKNGYDVLKILKSDDKTKEIPVFVITNLGINHERETLEMGAVKFYVKTNISLSKLVEDIKSVI